MTLKEIEKLASFGESVHLEFKKKANYPEKIVKELVAFANTEGGKLLLGVDDDGTVSGTRSIEGEAYVIEKAIEELIRPKLDYSVEMCHMTEKKGVAIFHISESHRKPHFVRDHPKTRKGTAYVRHNDESIQASREVREIIQRRLRNKDIQFTYGDKEKALLQRLNEVDQISLKDFCDLVNIPKFIASRTLIKLVLANVLDVIPNPKGDLYVLREH